MYKPKEKVLWFAIISRLFIIVIQFMFNRLIADHNAGVFISPSDSTEKKSLYDNIIVYLFDGFTRWDSQYFLHIAKYGYTYENTVAFFPLYPITVRYTSFILKWIFFPLNEHSTMVLAALLINFLCFIKSVAVFYDLSMIVLKDNNLAYKSSILYSINPASIFFSAFYSESMFAFVNFQVMISYAENNPYIYLPIGLSTVVRSNGLINIGFPVYSWIRMILRYTIPKFVNKNYDRKHSNKEFEIPYRCKTVIGSSIWLFNIIFLSTVPYVLLQLYNYALFCLRNEYTMPDFVRKYALDNNYLITGTEIPSWCDDSIPLSYSYVQNKYWDVGFMKYYHFKQIPNFLLAFPILFIILSQSIKYLNDNRVQLMTLGSFRKKKLDDISYKKNSPSLSPDIFVFVIHGMFLSMFCILFIHIQVSTRLLCSSSPLLYWYCASKMSHNSNKSKNFNPNDFELPENSHSKWKVFFFNQKEYTANDFVILSYFLGYIIIGSIMFSNFLPWT